MLILLQKWGGNAPERLDLFEISLGFRAQRLLWLDSSRPWRTQVTGVFVLEGCRKTCAGLQVQGVLDVGEENMDVGSRLSAIVPVTQLSNRIFMYSIYL